MNKKMVVAGIIVLIVILYSISIILGQMGLGVIGVYTDKKEYELGEKITVDAKNNGITLLCGVPELEIYKINEQNETMVYWNEIKGPLCELPQGYFFAEAGPLVWNPSEEFDYGDLKDGPQKEGKYKIVANIFNKYNTSDSIVVTIK